MQIKHKHILVPGQRYQDCRYLLKNPKVSRNVMRFNNHAQRSTPPYYLDVDNPLPTIHTHTTPPVGQFIIFFTPLLYYSIF